ncbi:MAG: zinc-ribbon domain-containing protein [Bacteroidales bacterium]
MKFCPQCGTTFDTGVRFCQECGFDRSTVETAEETMTNTSGNNSAETLPTASVTAQVTAVHPEVKPGCPKCGSNLVSGDRFCQECGFDTTGIIAPGHEVFEPPQPNVDDKVIATASLEKEPVSLLEKKQFCPQCGTTITSGDRFCPDCGFDTVTDQSTGEIKSSSADQQKVVPKPEPTAAPTQKHKKVIPPAATAYAPPASPAKPVAQQKSKKLWLWIALIVIGVGALGTAGWFGYNRYIAAPKESSVDTVAKAVVQEIAVPDTSSIKTEVSEPAVEALPEQTVASIKPPERINKEIAKPKSKQQTKAAQPNKPTQEPATPTQQSKPDLGIKAISFNTGNNHISKVIMEVGRKDDSKNKSPKNPTRITISESTMVVRITTDHYNGGSGTATAGSISIKGENGNVIGTYKAIGNGGKNGVPNSKWVAEPKILLAKGTYFIWDSDMGTWSKNILGVGFVMVEGYEIP